jgi:hypothetical protein
MSPGGPYELKMEGNGSVRRFFSAFTREESADTPAIRRIAPRNVSLIFIKLFSKKNECGDRRAQLQKESSAVAELSIETAIFLSKPECFNETNYAPKTNAVAVAREFFP